MAPESIQYLVQRQGGTLEQTTNDVPTVSEPTDVIISLRAVAINPADCKMIDAGHRGTQWPLVPGLDGAGIVQEVGDEVVRFVPGDRVVALFAAGGRGASFQNLSVVPERSVAKLPDSWSFQDAATLGIGYLTGMMGLGIGLQLPLPFVVDGPKSSFQPSSILLLGGSSAVGASTIQLLRLAVPNCDILATSSPKHHDHIIGLGANKVLDRSSATLVSDVKSATKDSRGVDAIIDVVGAAGSQRQVFGCLDPSGPMKYAQVWTGDEEIEAPNGVNSVLFRGRDLSRIQGGHNIMRAIELLLQEGRYKLPLPVKEVGVGLDGLIKALDLMRGGVSGEKLVVKL